MKVVLLHNLDIFMKEKILDNYKKDGYHEIWHENEDVLLKKGDEKIPDLETYLKVLASFLKRNSATNKSNGRVIDLTKAFEYAQKTEKFNKFDNHFTWYLRNIILNEILHENE